MRIFIYATTLTTFTSSIPMRGLVLEAIKLRNKDKFVFYFNSKDKYLEYMQTFFAVIDKLSNVEIIFDKFSGKLTNLKALLGFKKYLNINTKADLYISPGTLDFLGNNNIPLINILTDLSTIRTPQYSSVPWHGKYIKINQLKHSVKYSSKIICISDYTRNDLNELYPEVKNRTVTIYNGIENEWFDDKYEVFEVDNFTNDKNGYWIWYGYISKRKNILNLLKTYKILAKQLTSTELPKILLVGKLAPNQNEITDYINNDNLNNKVRLITYQHIYKLKYLVKNSKGLLFPSYYEGFGLPVIEAFSQGKSVMHSNVSSLPEIAGGLGISCDPYSIESIKNALLQMIELKDSEEDVNKRKNWASRFTYKNASKEFSKIIDEVVPEKK